MARILWVLMLAGSMAAAVAAGVEPRKWDEESWEGFGPGSWVHTRVTITPSGETSRTSERRTTLLRVEERQFVLSAERKESGPWEPAVEFTWPRSQGAADDHGRDAVAPEDAPTEVLKIDGKSYPCRKLPWNDSQDVVGFRWVSDEHGILKTEVVLGGKDTISTTVTSFAKTAKIGAKTIICTEVQLRSVGKNWDLTQVSLFSADVPGRLVRQEKTHRAGATGKSVAEVVAFERK